MQRKLMAQFLLFTVICTGAFAFKAEAGANPTPSQKPAFSCDTSTPIPKTVSNRNHRTLFAWKDRRNPHDQCASVTNRLNNFVRRNGGTTKGLVFNAGIVNNNTVVCVGTVTQFGCNAGNTIVNINQSDVSNYGEVIDQLQNKIDGLASGSTVIQSEANKGVALSEF